MNFGPERFIADLEALGHRVELVKAKGGEIFAVLHKYEIVAGIFSGRVIDLGLQCTADFPRSVHSAIHIRAVPQLYETGHIQNVRNVTASVLGEEWRYWSHNFGWSATCERSARTLMSQINGIFDRCA
jgi:hypothetical protein